MLNGAEITGRITHATGHPHERRGAQKETLLGTDTCQKLIGRLKDAFAELDARVGDKSSQFPDLWIDSWGRAADLGG